MVTIMVVVGILAAIAIPRLTQTAAFSSSAYRNEIASALRHAQKSAVSHRRLICAELTNSTVALKIATLAFAPGDPAAACGPDYSSPDGTPYRSSDKGVAAGGNLIGKTLYFQPGGEITADKLGTVFVVDTITIAGQPALRIDGRTGYVE
jgi:MSHA pilin protein MshC